MALVQQFFISVVFLLFSVPAWSGEQSTNRCTNDKGSNSANFAEGAYNYAQKIIEAVNAEKLENIFKLVDGELGYGPRKRFALQYTFDDVFGYEWKSNILDDEALCTRLGWRGYMIANGAIWYDHGENGWHIKSISGARIKEPLSEKINWEVDGKLIPAQCFVSVWMSGDNYEEFGDQFNIEDFQHFEKFVGEYYGRWPGLFQYLTPTWGRDEQITLATYLNDCFSGKISGGKVGPEKPIRMTLDNGNLKNKICDEDRGCDIGYKILRPLTVTQCQSLVPNFTHKCLEANLIHSGGQSGGSIGYVGHNVIYGLFQLDGDRKVILPLVNLGSVNDALNFVDDLH